MKFKFLDTVSWDSQAGGIWKRKVGKIYGVIPAGEKPSRQLFPELYGRPSHNISYTLPRDHESHVVVAGHKTYYPRVKDLRLVRRSIYEGE